MALFLTAVALLCVAQDPALESARRAYEKGDFHAAIEQLKAAETKDPNNGEILLLLTKSYLEISRYDDAVRSAEKAVAINPKSSVYHQWLGEALGAKADHASALSAYSLARKTVKEFETAVQLDEHNFDAAQDVIEYYCTAPSIVGGGEDKAQPVIQKLMSMDSAEGNYGAAVCKAVKKDFIGADAEYGKALDSKPKNPDRLFAIGDYFQQRGQGDKLLVVVAQADVLAPKDPRGNYYRAVAWILKAQNAADAEKLLRAYLQSAPPLSSYPRAGEAHYWLGRLFESQKNTAGAKQEYQEALKLNPKSKRAQEALKRLGS